MEVILAFPHGFCVGVKKAIETIDNLDIDKMKKPIYMLGRLVHNKHVVNNLLEKGIELVSFKDLDTIYEGTIIFTAHGVSPNIRSLCMKRGLEVIDTTCPFVQKIHQIVRDKLNEGFNVFFLGIEDHPEAIGVLGISSQIKLISFGDVTFSFPDNSVIVSQSTLEYKKLHDFYQTVLTKHPNIVLINEVCRASLLRQTEAVRLASSCDVAIVVGDKSSNNCRSLASVIENDSKCITFHVEDVEELNSLDIDYSNIKKVLVTSGASTPEYLTDEVIKYLKAK